MSGNWLEPITVEEALQFVTKILDPERLSAVQQVVLRLSWSGRTYEEIAEVSGYSIQHIRDTGYQLWQLLSRILGEKVTKTNVQSAIARQLLKSDSAHILRPTTGATFEETGKDFAARLDSTASDSGKTAISLAETAFLRDYTHPLTNNQEIFNSAWREPKLPGDQESLDSPFYVNRPPVEESICQEIVKPGALIRLRSPRRTGKTSLMVRILKYAVNRDYRTVRLNFSQADRSAIGNIDKFLRWLCTNTSRQLKLEPLLNDYWDEDLGSKVSCTIYFQAYLLQQTDTPLILALDEVDRIFEFPEVAQDFLPLLRLWHEEANNLEIWQQLRLIVSHSTEVYIPLNINQSPFNVGLSMTLPEFTIEQIQNLAKLHRLDWQSGSEATALMAMVGGHPYLVRLALYRLWHQEVTFEQLLAEAATQTSIYSNHLRWNLGNLQAHPELAAALKQVVSAREPVELEPILAYKLNSMGLVKLQGNESAPSCELYRLYFRDRLN